MTSWLFCFECEEFVKIIDMENLAFDNFMAKDSSPPNCKKHPKATHRLRPMSNTKFVDGKSLNDYKAYNLEELEQ